MDIIKGKNVFTGEAVAVTLANDYIARVEPCDFDFHLPYISPGFLDMQVNGYHGVDYSLEDLEEEQISSLVRNLAKSGTTRHVPTFVSMPHERLLRNIRILRQAIRRSPLLKLSIAGLHIEGPFISKEDGPRGAHDPKFVRDPDFSLFEQWQEEAEGTIRYITLAPELEGALDFIRKVVASGVKVSIGHTGASPDKIREAIAAGATLSTHLGNGSHTTVPRLRNYIWEQLAADELTAGIICDGYHLPPAVVKVFARAKGLGNLILVSDVALLGGFDAGFYKWGNLDVQVFEDGHLGLPGTSILAGAAHLLNWDIARFIEFTGYSLPETIGLCTKNPVRFLGLADVPENFLKEGEMTNICVFDYQPKINRLHIVRTQLGNHVLFN